jgi:hypothetical protein
MRFHKLTGIVEEPAKADKSAPTDVLIISLKFIIGGVREALIRAPLRFAEAPTMWPE